LPPLLVWHSHDSHILHPLKLEDRPLNLHRANLLSSGFDDVRRIPPEDLELALGCGLAGVETDIAGLEPPVEEFRGGGFGDVPVSTFPTESV
jgi:hypothetical protein